MKKQEETKEDEESKLEEILEEEQSSDDEETSDEENPKEGTIENFEFNQFIRPVESRAPVLEEIETQPEVQNLEQDVASTSGQNENQRQINYSTTQDNFNYPIPENSKEQQDYGPPVLTPVNLGEDFERNQFLNPSDNTRLQQQGLHPEMIQSEFREEKRTLPFEKDDRKYKQVKLK